MLNYFIIVKNTMFNKNLIVLFMFSICSILSEMKFTRCTLNTVKTFTNTISSS